MYIKLRNDVDVLIIPPINTTSFISTKFKRYPHHLNFRNQRGFRLCEKPILKTYSLLSYRLHKKISRSLRPNLQNYTHLDLDLERRLVSRDLQENTDISPDSNRNRLHHEDVRTCLFLSLLELRLRLLLLDFFLPFLLDLFRPESESESEEYRAICIN